MGEWKTLETAPKDGTVFIIARDDKVAHSYSGVAHWKAGRFRDPTEFPSKYWNEPTHWMSIPTFQQTPGA